MTREVPATDFLEGVVNETVAGGIEVVLPSGSVLNDTTAAAGVTIPRNPLGHPITGPFGGPIG